MNLDKLSLDLGSAPEKVTNYYALIKLLPEYLRVNKTLKVLSMNGCGINNEMMGAIGRGLQMNEGVELISLKHNAIGDDGIVEVCKGFTENKQIRL